MGRERRGLHRRHGGDRHRPARLLRDIGDALAREKINVTAVRTQTRDDLAFMRFTFDVADVGAAQARANR